MGLEGIKKTLWIITEVFPVDEKINLPLAKPYDFIQCSKLTLETLEQGVKYVQN